MAGVTRCCRFARSAIVLLLLGLCSTRALALTPTTQLSPPAATPTVTPSPPVGDCGDVCDGRSCIAVPLLRPGTCGQSGDSCRCVPVTPGPGECDVACDGRPCMSQCPDGTVASGFCTALTVDTGCGCNACKPVCVGDCDRDDEVTVNELLTMANMALGHTASCPAGDTDGDGTVGITEISAAVNRALNGCPGALPTPTPDPLERESGACYESSDCFPSDVYPFHAFTTNRAFCCYLVRTINGGTFSWCPAETFDPSSLSCTECAFPCK